MGCVVWVCSKRLWQNAPSIFLHKSTENSVVVKLQLWHHSVSAAVVNPTAFLPHHTSQCTSGDYAFATQIPSMNRSWRFTGVGLLCGKQHQVHQVCVLVPYRKRVMLLTVKCLQLASPTLHVREIPFLVSHATFLPFPYMYRLDSSRAHPAQSENIAIANPID